LISGKVEDTGYDSSLGVYVTVNNGRCSITYCNMGALSVMKGVEIEQNQEIGKSGMTGTVERPTISIIIKTNDGSSFIPVFVLKKQLRK